MFKRVERCAQSHPDPNLNKDGRRRRRFGNECLGFTGGRLEAEMHYALALWLNVCTDDGHGHCLASPDFPDRCDTHK